MKANQSVSDEVKAGDELSLIVIVSGAAVVDSTWNVQPSADKLRLRLRRNSSVSAERFYPPTRIWRAGQGTLVENMPTFQQPLLEPQILALEKDIVSAQFWLMEVYCKALSEIKDGINSMLDTLHLRHSRTIARLLNRPKA